MYRRIFAEAGLSADHRAPIGVDGVGRQAVGEAGETGVDQLVAGHGRRLSER